MADTESPLLRLLEANDAAAAAALAATIEQRWDDACRHYETLSLNVQAIVRHWATTVSPDCPRSFVSFRGCGGTELVLRWRDHQLDATDDDKPACPDFWHERAFHDDADPDLVCWERYSPDGARVAHGFIHPWSRYLVQSG